jgi:hypothetical protein
VKGHKRVYIDRFRNLRAFCVVCRGIKAGGSIVARRVPLRRGFAGLLPSLEREVFGCSRHRCIIAIPGDAFKAGFRAPARRQDTFSNALAFACSLFLAFKFSRGKMPRWLQTSAKRVRLEFIVGRSRTRGANNALTAVENERLNHGAKNGNGSIPGL